MNLFKIQKTRINVNSLFQLISDSKTGGVVTFSGIVRDFNEGKNVKGIIYEAYQELANNEGEIILNEAQEKFKIIDSIAVHRIGDLVVGDIAVHIIASASHRKDAFDACQYIIDEIKLRLPIWKNEY